ncbi:phospholipase D-like domain-containing protein [Caenispirillum salinarum]|uniref:phospholipase D-like domain-containing protein n=1 Tax=Caenispirillum salinarum TaxID=859058 RepID=UPI003851746E
MAPEHPPSPAETTRPLKDGSDNTPLLEPGVTCWKIAHTPRFGMVVDCEDYFAAFREACMNARHRIFLVGWDFDTRIHMLMNRPSDGWPVKVGPFISKLVDERPDLQIFILKWDIAFFTMVRQNPWPWRALKWKMSDRIHFKLDGEHPWGSCHHQKVVCIDDRFAMMGGIDITRNRWDTRDHIDHDRRRRNPAGGHYPPHHDASVAVEGEAARVLEEMCRIRWERGTGERLDPPPRAEEIEGTAESWPGTISVEAEDVSVGIARTMPPYKDEPGVFEIEALTLRAIRDARRLIYLESQYFASRTVALAVAERLREQNPPEVVVVNPYSADGWLEEKTMDTARAQNVALCRKSDHAGRFRIYYPVTKRGKGIYVHAKVTIIDDRFLKVGSANLNNRSMGFDTESDIALFCEEDDTIRRDAVRGRMIDLLAEHLDHAPSTVACVLRDLDGRLIDAIETLRRDEGRSLRVLCPEGMEELEDAEELMVESQMADPERPEKPLRRIKNKLKWVFDW